MLSDQCFEHGIEFNASASAVVTGCVHGSGRAVSVILAETISQKATTPARAARLLMVSQPSRVTSMAQPIDADPDWPLPHPWQEYFSNSQQRPYYANPVTNERLWSRHEVRQRCEPSARFTVAAAAPYTPHAHSHSIPPAAMQPAEHRGRQGLGFAAAAGDASSMQQGAPSEHQPRHSYSSSASHPPHGSGASYHQAPPPYDSNARRPAPYGNDGGRHDRERYSDRGGGGFSRPHQSSSSSSSSRNAHQGGRDSYGRDSHSQGHGNVGRNSGGSVVLMTDEEQRVFRQLQLRTGAAGIEKEVEFRRDLFPRAPPPPAELFASPAFADPELMTAKDELNAAKNALDAMDLQAWCVSAVGARMRW